MMMMKSKVATLMLMLMLIIMMCNLMQLSMGIWLNLPKSGTKCVSEEIHPNVVVLADYYVISDEHVSQEPTISVKVTSPYGNNLHLTENVTHGQFAFTTHEAGNYLACLWVDGHNPKGAEVSVNLDWRTGVAAKDWELVARKEKIEYVKRSFSCPVATLVSFARRTTLGTLLDYLSCGTRRRTSTIGEVGFVASNFFRVMWRLFDKEQTRKKPYHWECSKGVELELKKLEGAVEAIHENLLYLKTKEAEMRTLSEKTNARVALCSIMSLAVCITVSGLQLLYLKRYFRKKKLI